MNPTEVLKHVLPRVCEQIENRMNQSRASLLTDHQGDVELVWNLTLFSELVRARGDKLLVYKLMIMSIFHQCTCLIHKESYGIIAKAALKLLRTLCDSHLISLSAGVSDKNESFVNCLPIRVSLSEYN